MSQLSFSDFEHSTKRKQTRREKFLLEMDQVIPWSRLLALIEPVYPKGRTGRPPYALEAMLRIHFMQQWFALSDPAMEEALYDSYCMRKFAGLSLSMGGIPDETTILNFRRLLETHDLAEQFFATINDLLTEQGLMLRQGTIVDATIISAPSSTKNSTRSRDPEMRSTKKGNNWHFGMKAHIGVDFATGFVHTTVCTSANEHDVTQTHALLHGEEEYVFGDSGYIGAEKRPELEDVDVEWHIAMKPSQRQAIKDEEARELTGAVERTKASIRAKVEHAFRILKCQFGYRKVRYRGLLKNTAQVVTLLALGNIWMAREDLMGGMG
ncbi:IS5 family transposase [Orrella sp. 11846]|uniref:IS5 family transposase n=1 Tax=Orrella sp. 11846 TaxID=3409913 RepID=UPI003B58DE31